MLQKGNQAIKKFPAEKTKQKQTNGSFSRRRGIETNTPSSPFAHYKTKRHTRNDSQEQQRTPLSRAAFFISLCRHQKLGSNFLTTSTYISISKHKKMSMKFNF
jgi:hypothetical protein